MLVSGEVQLLHSSASPLKGIPESTASGGKKGAQNEKSAVISGTYFSTSLCGVESVDSTSELVMDSQVK